MTDLDFLAPWLIPILFVGIAGQWVARMGLAWLNRRHLHAHAGSIPPALAGAMDEPTYRRAVEYALAQNRLERVETTFDAGLLAALLWTGALSKAYELLVRVLGGSHLAQALALFAVITGINLLSLPLAWYDQFRLEHKFGFNNMTARMWWLDRCKNLLLTAALGIPVVLLLLRLPDWMGAAWWLWAWGTLLVLQLLLMILAPKLILPLFNRFTPLPDGPLRDRLLALANRTGFRNRNILVMDGSRRSSHSNAFFTGFGRFRRIVLFDTLLAQLEDRELEAVLAHEIGHYQLGHVPRTLLALALALLAILGLLAWLVSTPWLAPVFGFDTTGVGPVLLLLLVYGGVVTFWSSCLWHAWSRRHEYQADRYAAEAVADPAPLIRALRKLAQHNLSNLTPHPLYSAFHYSHPTLIEREQALHSP